MSENTPLLHGGKKSQRNAEQPNAPSTEVATTGYDYEEEYYEEDEFYISNTVKYTAYGGLILIGIPLIYFLLVFLPNLAPPAENVPSLALVDDVDVYLHPIEKPKLHSFTDIDSIDFGEEEEEDEDEEDEFIYEIGLEKIDNDSPYKKIPNFKNWSLLSRASKLFKKHFDQLPNHTLKKKPAKRIILLGDIHGSLLQFTKFLNNVKYDGGINDHVIMLGDFLAKGPNSIGVLEFAIENKIGCILGNHELEILKRYSQFHGLPQLTYTSPGENETKPLTKDFHSTESYDLDDLMRVAKKLTPEHIQYLSTCPIIKELGPVPHYTNNKQTKNFKYPSNGVAVHGGLLWNKLDLKDQNPVDVSTVRNLLPPDWKIPTDDRHTRIGGIKSQPWYKHWTYYQRDLVQEKLSNGTIDELTIGTKVYYGHDAGRGLMKKEFSIGLDSGCVYGAQLTGSIIWSEVVIDKKSGLEKIEYRQLLTQVNC